jgi:hypothetical protein
MTGVNHQSIKAGFRHSEIWEFRNSGIAGFRKSEFRCSILYVRLFIIFWDTTLQAISKMQITPKDKAWADEKAQHTWEYVSILRRSATPQLGVRCVFEIAFR